MPEFMDISVNGEAETLVIEADETLLSVLRDKLQLTGTKCGCNQGVCGACTVLAGDRPVRSCLTLAADCDGLEITTVEGLEGTDGLSVVQRAIVASGAIQCGFCTPGMAIAATTFLAANPTPDEAAVREALSGNLCRCSGYAKLVEAVLDAANAQGENA